MVVRLLSVVLPLAAAACGSDSPSGPTQQTLRLQSIAPATGSTTGSTTVTITGSGISSDATVTIGGAAATNVVVQGSSTLTAVTGERTSGGVADVVVSSGGRSVSLPNAFTFVAPSGANRLPSISNFRSVGSRVNQPSGFADLDETLQVSATVADSETSAASLTYEWSGPGTFTSSGSTATWKVPATLPSVTPATATVSLKVSETFTEGGVTHRQSATGTFAVRVHDSQKEIADIGQDFLLRFSDSRWTTNEVLHNFSTTCDGGSGRANEANDVDRNRATYIQDFNAARVTHRPPVTFNFDRGCFPAGRQQPNADACASYTVHWEVTGRSNGRREITDGVDYVSAVLENDRWLLCHSDFIGTVVNTVTGEMLNVVW